MSPSVNNSGSDKRHDESDQGGGNDHLRLSQHPHPSWSFDAIATQRRGRAGKPTPRLAVGKNTHIQPHDCTALTVLRRKRPCKKGTPMFFSKSLALWAFPAAISASFCASGRAVSCESLQTESYARFLPLKNISYEFGSKAMSGYFVQEDKVCLVTLFIIEKIDPDRPLPLTAARVRLMLNPGQIAGLDSEEGGSLNVTCGAGAATVTVDSGERSKLVTQQGVAANTTAGRIQSRPSAP
jgi:hypothetical protein